MDTWRIENNPRKQTALAVGCIIVGIILLYGFRNFDSSGFTNSLSGFLLGVLLFGLGISAFFVRGKQTITVDPKTRFIFIEDKSKFASSTKTIPFSEIENIQIGCQGKRSNFVTFYYLILKLRSGGTYPLFAPGRFYEGASNHGVVEGWRERLEGYLKQ
jgi:hypothetical protein